MTPRPSRRALLAGAGGALLLPFLPSLMGGGARAADVAPRRLLVFFLPNGLPDAFWRPTTTGAGWAASPITQALDPIRDRAVVISGLRHADDPSGNGHQTSAQAALTGGTPGSVASGQSFDQVIADVAGADTLRASLNLSAEHDTPCAFGQCSSSEHISWRSFSEPSPLETSIRAVFGKVIGTGAGWRSPTARASVLDAVRADLKRYTRDASADDAQRLDAYAEGLRSIERRAAFVPASTCPSSVPLPSDDGYQYASDADVRTMLDLLVLGLQCDATRVATFMIGKAGSDRPLSALGVPLGHHELSHTTPSARHTALGTWALGHLGYLVNALDAVTDTDGASLLSHTDVLFLSDMGDGSRHSMTDVPCVLAGAGAARWAGQHLEFQDRPMADLYLSLMAAHGVDQATFGALGTSSLLDLS